MPQNIDLQEIHKFAQMAQEWWDPNGKCKPLHIINPLRLNYIQTQCGDISNKLVLDVGCGGGILSECLAKLGAQVIGLDMAQASLEVAQHHAQQNGLVIEYIKSSIEDYTNNTDKQFDIITCMELLEHVPDPKSIITACAKLLKPNGRLFLSTINRNQKAKLLLIYGAEYITRILPKGTHDFNRFIRPSELMRLIEQANLQISDIIGIEYHLLKNQFTLSQNVDVNYIVVASKIA